MDIQFFKELMQLALLEAKKAYDLGEVPVGAVVAQGAGIIAAAHNRVEATLDSTAHAELLAIREASKHKGDWRITDSVLCVTLEPCPMCASAIRLSRIPVVVFGVEDPRMGGFGSLFDLSQDTRMGAPTRVISGVLREECQSVLDRFFKALREKDNK